MKKKETERMNYVNNIHPAHLSCNPQSYDKSLNATTQPTVTNEDSKKLYAQMENSAQINRALISFSGKGFKLNSRDKMFLEHLTDVFKLSEETSNNLKNVLKNFLQENKLKSLDEISSEEYVKEQLILLEKLNKVIKCKDFSSNYFTLMEKIRDRFQLGKYYTIAEFNFKTPEMQFLEQLVENAVNLMEKNDKKCLDAISETFNCTPQQRAELEKIVKETLEEDKLLSLKNFAHDDFVGTQALLVDRIKDKLGLSDYEATLITLEFSNRAFANEISYTPGISPLDRNFEVAGRDTNIFRNVIKNYDIKFEDMDNLRTAMKKDAYANGFESIMDLFKPGNKFEEFKATNEVLNSKTFLDKKADILMDFTDAGKKIDKILNDIKIKEAKNGKSYRNSVAISCHLGEKLGLPLKEVLKIKDIVYTAGCSLNDKKEVEKLAYNISEKLGREDSYREIKQLIEEVRQMSKEEIDDFGFKYCRLVIDNKS